eukprot:CAMPEP_0119555418 /NCGR_PEP_ID=MMETSP1352-20130426/7641_1 /TAXON_ID=265584 /ORGANISM="Stauroneis constricta, Strain CCMP1120" /LENGTH=339 /DNA_ID=CAMNT_0007602177 /DNA_START=308 /DNA_END=1327 /DNA_ORIENTATION=+
MELPASNASNAATSAMASTAPAVANGDNVDPNNAAAGARDRQQLATENQKETAENLPAIVGTNNTSNNTSNDSSNNDSSTNTTSNNSSNNMLQILLQIEHDTVTKTAEWIALRSSTTTTINNNNNNPIWREKVVQWYYDIVDYSGMATNNNREIVYLAIHIMDKYVALQQSKQTSAEHYQTISIASLFISLKLTTTKTIALPELLRLSSCEATTNSSKQIISIGKDILQSLSWKYRIITPFDFLQQFCNIEANDKDKIIYCIELQVYDIYFSNWLPSQLCQLAIDYVCSRKDNDDDIQRLHQLYIQSHDYYDSSDGNNNNTNNNNHHHTIIPNDDDDME